MASSRKSRRSSRTRRSGRSRSRETSRSTPGNTLWRSGRLSGVVDWTQASWGPASIDLEWMRWNLACDHGLGAAKRFLAIQRALTGNAIDHHPYWDILAAVDLVTALDPADPPAPDERHRRLEEHVAAALARP
ncbi:MAG: phosphotransferase [Pseudonocardiaceae bacterium]